MAADGSEALMPPLIVFLFSSPLVRQVIKGKETRLVPSQQLDATAELKELHQWLSDSCRSVRLRSETS